MFADNQFDSGAPIYTQIMNKIKLRILSGQWAAGERIPAVRELAVEFGVNPNTMQRSLSELERDGLLFSERTTGRYITRDAALIERTRRQMGEELMAAFVEQMEHMGYKTTEDILRELRDGGYALTRDYIEAKSLATVCTIVLREVVENVIRPMRQSPENN